MTMLTDPDRPTDGTLPAGFIPTPSAEYNAASSRRGAARQISRPSLKLVRSTDAEPSFAEDDAAKLPTPVPLPVPPLQILFSSRALIYKQDPSVAEIGIRKVLLRGLIGAGPGTSRIKLAGVASVTPNAMSDFIQTPGTEAFDAVHTFAVVHQTLAMCQRTLGATIRWQWNGTSNTDPITVSPRAGVTMNAFYSRTQKALKFFFFNKPGAPAPAPVVYTCRSLDIVSHETGHAVLNSLKPGWLASSANPQTGALHEAFGDIVAIFLALAQLDQVEALIVQTKGNLHDKSFLSDMAEEFGLALGRDNGLRNADNDKKLSEVSSEVHDLSQVFTGGIYDVLADIFAFERKVAVEDEAFTLLKVGQYLFSLILRAIRAAPDANATFAHVVNQMLAISASDGKPAQYRTFIRNRFTLREVVVAAAPLAGDGDDQPMEAVEHTHLVLQDTGLQDRSGCCGTMRLREYSVDEAMIDAELAALRGGIGGRDPDGEQMAAE